MRALVLTMLALAACNREGAPPVAPVESTSDTSDAGPPAALFISATQPTARDRCTARLVAAAIKTGADCTLDERISKSSGTLLYPCSGEGAVEAVFGEHRFEGKLSDGALSLDLTTELDWEDGCHWETKQTLRGDWRRDAKKLKLSWTYAERPVSGSSCFGQCVARADIEVDELSQ
jgi:hypothetical protein